MYRYKHIYQHYKKLFNIRSDILSVYTWNPKQPFIYGCFNWMIPNLYIGNGCLGFQVRQGQIFPNQLPVIRLPVKGMPRCSQSSGSSDASQVCDDAAPSCAHHRWFYECAQTPHGSSTGVWLYGSSHAPWQQR